MAKLDFLCLSFGCNEVATADLQIVKTYPLTWCADVMSYER